MRHLQAWPWPLTPTLLLGDLRGIKMTLSREEPGVLSHCLEETHKGHLLLRTWPERARKCPYENTEDRGVPDSSQWP